ncbi:MAG: hypothetical protein ACREX4_12035 [Gammaproteobacteria bacterium]
MALDNQEFGGLSRCDRAVIKIVTIRGSVRAGNYMAKALRLAQQGDQPHRLHPGSHLGNELSANASAIYL